MGSRTFGFRGGCILVIAVLAVIIAGSWFTWIKTAHGFSARAQPSGIESWLADLSRRLALPRGVGKVKNPYPAPTAQELAGARTLFLARCAQCHGPNGAGETPLGRNLYPKPPDLRLPGTQGMSDGALFWTIRNGVRLSAMPAWPELNRRQTWMLVEFIRSLPARAAPSAPLAPAEQPDLGQVEHVLEPPGSGFGALQRIEIHHAHL